MHTKIKTLLVIVSFLFAGAAQAQAIKSLEAGFYEVTSFSSDSKDAKMNRDALCSAFSLSAKELSASSLPFGTHYAFETKNSSSTMASDLDKNCEFREKNTREEKDGKTILIRVNEEYCHGKMKSRAVSTATLHSGEIRIQQETSGSPTYTCVWHN